MSSATTTAGAMFRVDPHTQAVLTRLEERKRVLELAISTEERRPCPDSTTLRRLKREKLMVKENIYRARHPALQ